MKTLLTEQETQILIEVGIELNPLLRVFDLGTLIEELDEMLDGYHYEFVRHYNGWEVTGDMALTYKRCPELINAIAGTIYIHKKAN